MLIQHGDRIEKSIIWLSVTLKERVKKKIPEIRMKINCPFCLYVIPSAGETQTGGSKEDHQYHQYHNGFQRTHLYRQLPTTIPATISKGANKCDGKNRNGKTNRISGPYIRGKCHKVSWETWKYYHEVLGSHETLYTFFLPIYRNKWKAAMSTKVLGTKFDKKQEWWPDAGQNQAIGSLKLWSGWTAVGRKCGKRGQRVRLLSDGNAGREAAESDNELSKVQNLR